MKIAWLSDIHLDSCKYQKDLSDFYYKIKESKADIILITGDISNSRQFLNHIHDMRLATNKRIYYVLGNHDYYYSSIHQVRQDIEAVFGYPYTYLIQVNDIPLNKNTCLLGVDSWADGQNGDIIKSQVRLNDHFYIKELADANQKGTKILADKLKELASEDLAKLRGRLTIALLSGYKNIIIAMHVPPFDSASLYKGKMAGDDFQPFFSCKMIGEYLLEVAKEHPKTKFLVLCGHSHHKFEFDYLPNLRVRAAGATYGKPEIQGIISTRNIYEMK